MMSSIFRRSHRGLKQTRRALAELENAVVRLNKQRNTHGILPLLGPVLRDTKRELDAYETRISEGVDMRAAAIDFRFWLGQLAAEIRQSEGEVIVERGLTPSSRSPWEPLYGPLEKLKTVSRHLNGPETSFQRELDKQIKKSGVTPYALAAFYNRDPSFIYKLRSGERKKASRVAVTCIATALMECSSKISEKDANRLMRKAGYPPLNSN